MTPLQTRSRRFSVLTGMLLSTFFTTGLRASETIGFWRFENAEGRKITNSAGGEYIGEIEGEGVDVVELTAQGAGSKFRSSENLRGARFPADGGSILMEGGNPGEWQQLTVEALVHLSSSRADAGGQTIVSCGSFDEEGGTWMLGITGEQSSRGARRLIFSYQYQPGPWSSSNRVAIDSGIELEVNKDYYVAVAVNPGETSKDGIVFYVKKLASQDAMKVVRRDHPAEALAIVSSGNDIRIGNLKSLRAGWTGLIDEVRVTGRQLSEDELFVKDLP